MSDGRVLLRCENCGDRVILARDYDPDYGSYGEPHLVHESNEWELCPDKKDDQ